MTPAELLAEKLTAAPLPWNVRAATPWIIEDANGRQICSVRGDAMTVRAVATAILVSVNTLGGFEAYQPGHETEVAP